MEISIAVQTVVFLKAVLLGAALAVLYDVLRAVRREARAGVGATAAADALFWLAALAALFVFVLTAARGEGRGYILLGAGFGGALYFLTVSPPVLLALSLVLRAGAKLLQTPRFLYRRAKAVAVRHKIRDKLPKKMLENLKKPFHFFKK